MAIKIPKKEIDVTGIELTPKEAFQKKEKKEINEKEAYSKGQFSNFNRIRYQPTGKGRRVIKLLVLFFCMYCICVHRGYF